jgi:hypothetical protein
VKAPKNLHYSVAGLVAVITCAVYLTSLQNEFVEWDDSIYVYENLHVRSLDISFFRWAFLDFHAGNWHPLTWISHAVDYALWGLNPWGHHLTNIILHSLNASIVVLLIMGLIEALRKTTIEHERPLKERMTLLVGGATGILFGLHPIHVESVAWVAERKDLLCALFFLLSMSAYAKYGTLAHAETPHPRSESRFLKKLYLLSLGSFTLALLSKPMAVTLPVCLLMLDWYPLKRIQSFRTFWIAFVEKLPFLALSLVSSILTILAQAAGKSIVPIEYAPVSTRMLVASKALMVYLGKMLVPLNLIPFYPYPSDVSLLSFDYLSAVVLVLGITTVCIVVIKGHEPLLSVWGYYVVTLMPVLGIVQVGNQFLADRYAYLPSLGPFLLVGLAVAWLFEKVNELKHWSRPATLLCAAAAICILVSLSYLTVKQIGVWQNSISLWTYVINKEPVRAPLAYYNRGVFYAKKGQVDRALYDFKKTIMLDPSDYKAYYNLGVLYGSSGLFDMAIECFSMAIVINQNYDVAYLYRGTYYARTGRMEQARADYQKACDLGNENGCRQVKLRQS